MTPSEVPTVPSEYLAHLTLIAESPVAQPLLDAVRHAVKCTESEADDPHADHVPIWWRQVIEAYRAAVPDDDGAAR